ncbi:MAG: isochorismatase family protein [Phycisphaerae bacterium]|nr:isochorismatase family protein [Phycisphaerae bacterium]
MGKYLFRRRFRRVLIDIQTQYDLIYGNGHDHKEILHKIRRIMAWSRVHNVPIISIALAKTPDICEDDICVEGTPGQKKIRYTMLPCHKTFCPESCTDIPENILREYRQIIFNIRENDPFALPRADRLLTNLKADEFVLFGIGLNDVMKYTALGLLKRDKKVSILSDAIDFSENDIEDEMTARKLAAKGADYIETASITGESKLCGPSVHPEPWRDMALTR